MPKKLTVLLIIFLISLSVLIFVRFFYYNSYNSLLSPEVNSPPLPASIASLSLLPNPIVTTATESAEVGVVIDNRQRVDLVQLELSYDPTVIYNLNIFPGNYFTNPMIILENIDYKNGRISYALKASDINPDSNIVAVITFNVLSYGIQKESEISFLPKTLIKYNNKTVELDSTNNTKIIFKPLFYPLPFPSTPSAVLQ